LRLGKSEQMPIATNGYNFFASNLQGSEVAASTRPGRTCPDFSLARGLNGRVGEFWLCPKVCGGLMLFIDCSSTPTFSLQYSTSCEAAAVVNRKARRCEPWGNLVTKFRGSRGAAINYSKGQRVVFDSKLTTMNSRLRCRPLRGSAIKTGIVPKARKTRIGLS